MSSSRIWDFWSKYYEGLWVQKWSLKPTRERILTELKNLYPRDGEFTFLDAGCGVGELLEEISEVFPRAKLFGLDYSMGMTEKSKARVPGGIICHQPVEALGEKADTLLPNSFDVVFCTHSFPYYKDQQRVLRLFHRRLKKRGLLILAFASEVTLYDRLVMGLVKLTTGKAKYPSKEGLRQMSKGLFQIEKEGNAAIHFWMPTILFALLRKEEAKS